MKKLLAFFLALALWPTVSFAPLEFDGIDDNVKFGDINALDAQSKMTWSFWAWRGPFVSGTVVVYMIIDVSFAPDNGWMIRPKSFGGVTDAIEVTIMNAGSAIATGPTGSFPTNVWSHFAIIYDGAAANDALKLIVLRNAGQLSLSFSGLSIPASIGDNTAILQMTDGGTNTYRLSNLRMWKRANTIAEMQSIYSARLRGADSNADGIPMPDFAPQLDFLHGASASSAFIVDRSGNGFHGVATNGANGSGMLGVAESILTGK